MKNLKINLIIVFIFLILLVGFVLISEGPGEFVDMLRSLKYVFIIAAFICTLVFWFGEAVIMHSYSGCLAKKPKWGASLRISMIGRFYDAVTPFGSGGQAVQGYAMIKDGMKPGYAVLIIVMKSIAYQLAVAVLSVMSMIIFGPFFRSRVPNLMILLTVGLVINTIVLFFYSIFFIKKEKALRIIFTLIKILRRFRLIKKPFKYKKLAYKEVTLFREGLGLVASKPALLIKTFIYQLMRLLFLYSVPFFIFLAIDNRPSELFHIVSSQAILTLIVSYVPLPGASGGTEGVGYLFFKLFFRDNLVLSALLLWRILTFYSKIVIGGIFALLSPEKPLDSEYS
jgi:uncharacterized protein (TIRG00374 family)